MANRIQLRRGGAQEWANANPTLAQGELGIELDTGRIKIGDGVTAWNSLRYERPIESTSNTPNTLVQRDADGNFAAGSITATLIGNAFTANRLSSSRQIALGQDLQGAATFDGSENVTINATLNIVATLPHYDGTITPTGEYTKVVVDAKGRIVNASNPTTLAAYGIAGSVSADEGTKAQPFDLDLKAISDLTTTGIISRSGANTMSTRTITGTATRISVNDGGGINGNPTIDLITTAVVDGDYNTESLTSVSSVGGSGEPYGTETVNAVKFTVDEYGRLTSATNVPIATATEGSKYASYDAGTAYSRYDIIEEGGNVYQALAAINAGSGAPSHTSGDSGQWRYLAAAATEQKGLASFAQEDFDVDGNGHVTIAAAGVDNTQLQNNRIIYTDGNTIQEFELDNELTTSTAHTGFDYLNYIKINDTSGNLLFGANNTGDGAAGEIDVNVRSYFSDPDITLDGAVNQTLDKTGDGNLTFQLTQNSASARNLSILSTNAGSGTSTVTITAEDLVDIDASDANGKVHVEDARFQDNYIATSDATMHLDPGDDRAVTGLVRIWGDLQVDGVTTTVNSTTMTVDDVVLTLGGDTAPSADDNLDRGVEFRYYDTQARLGFYGWDTDYTDLGGHEGGYRFLHAATNTSETFAGTDSGIIAGNLKLTTNTNSTSNTTGDLVVAGGVGITQDVNIGGLVDIDSTLRVHSTSRFDDNMVIQGASKTLQLNNGSGTTRIELQSTTGNADFYGIVNITNDLNINTNKFNVASATGNTLIAGTLGVTGDTTLTGALDLNNTLDVSGLVHFESVDVPTVALNQVNGFYEIQNSDYGSFQFDGGGYVAGTTVFNDHVYVNGQILQREDTTANYNRQNYLEVRYKLRTGTRAAYTPSYATHDTSNLRVYGGAGIATTLHVGGTGAGEGLFVGKEGSGDTVKFSVLGASGNTDIQGTLDVAGNSEFNGTVDVDADFAVRNGTTDKFTVDNVTGNTVIEGTLNGKGDVDFDSALNVDGNTTLVGTLTVTNTSEFNNTVDVDADFAVRTGAGVDKFTVASASGNVATDGTLVVQGQTTINDSLIVDAANEVFSIRNGSAVEKFGVDADNGNTNIIGTLTVGDATQINDTLGASGIVTLTNNTDQTLTGLYAADGAVRLTGGMGVARNLAVGGAARIYGATELTGALDLNSSADISGALVTHDNVTITADNKEFAIQNGSAVDKFTVDTDNGNTDIRGTLDVGGDVTAEANLTITGNLTVNGTTTTVNSAVTTLDDPIITLGGDTAPASNDAKDRGVEFRYYDTTAKTGFFGLDRSSLEYVFLTTTTNASEVISGTDGDLRAGSLHLTGAGTSLDVDANANVDGTLTVDGQIISQVSSGPALVIPNTTKINNLNADLLDGMTSASANTATTIVNRDSNGDFAANQITVNNGIGALAGIQGNATTADALRTARTITIDGVVDGSVSFDGSTNVTISTTYNDADITALAAMAGTGFVTRTAANTYAQRTLQVTASSGITLTNADGVSGNPTINVASASTNAANNLVLRDGSGGFSAGAVNVTSLAASGAATVGTTLGVTGITTLTGLLNANGGIAVDTSNFTVDGTTGAVSTASTLNADGATTLGSTLTVTGASEFNSTVDVDADFAVRTSAGVDKFTVASASGNTTVAGTLGVTGTSTFTGALTANGGVVGNVTGQVSDISNHDTGDLAEGTNLYYTDERVDDRVAALISGGTGITATYNDAGNLLTLSAEFSEFDTDDIVEGSTNLFTTAARTRSHFTYGTGITHDGSGGLSVTQSDINTDNITEGVTNIFYTEARFDTSLSGKTTTDLAEGTNLYYTDARADARIAAATTDDLTEGATNLYYTTARANTDFDTKLAAASTDDLSEGATNLYYTDARADARIAAADTDALSEGAVNLYYTDARADARIAAATTDDLSEGATNQYYTEARVQTKLDNAFAQLQAMLNNLATSTTLALNLSGDPTPGAVVAMGAITNNGTGGFSNITGVATTSSGPGSGLTLDLTTSAGVVTGVSVNAGGTDYLISDIITVANPNLGGVASFNFGTLGGGTGYTTATNVPATSVGGAGTGLTVDITASSGVITNIVVNNPGIGFTANELVYINQAGASNGSIRVANVYEDATFSLADITTMEVGATVTGATTGTTGVITALGTNQITVDTVSGFFKVGEVVSANDVTTLTIQSFG